MNLLKFRINKFSLSKVGIIMWILISTIGALNNYMIPNQTTKFGVAEIIIGAIIVNGSICVWIYNRKE